MESIPFAPLSLCALAVEVMEKASVIGDILEG